MENTGIYQIKSIKTGRIYIGSAINIKTRTITKAEKALDNAEFDYVIQNNGTISDLIDKIRNILIENKLIKNK